MSNDNYSAAEFLESAEGVLITVPPKTWEEAKAQWIVKYKANEALPVDDPNKLDAMSVPFSEMVEFFNPLDFGMAVLLLVVVFLLVRWIFRRFWPGLWGMLAIGLMGGMLTLPITMEAGANYYGWTSASSALVGVAGLFLAMLSIPISIGRAYVNAQVNAEIRWRKIIREARREWGNTSDEPRFTGIFTGGESGKSRRRRDR